MPARKDHPLSGACSLAALTGAGWITTSVTRRAEDELTPLFYSRDLPAPRIVVQAHSALMLMMLPVQWEHSAPFAGLLSRIDVGETLQAPPITIVRRSALAPAPAGEYFCAWSGALPRIADAGGVDRTAARRAGSQRQSVLSRTINDSLVRD